MGRAVKFLLRSPPGPWSPILLLDPSLGPVLPPLPPSTIQKCLVPTEAFFKKLCMCVCVCAMYEWVPAETRRGTGSPGAAVAGNCQLPRACWNGNGMNRKSSEPPSCHPLPISFLRQSHHTGQADRELTSPSLGLLNAGISSMRLHILLNSI